MVKSFEALERAYQKLAPLPRERGSVRLICVRKGGGAHDCPARVTLSESEGVAGDRWSRGKEPDPEAQVTLMSAAVAELLCNGGMPLHAAGDNLLVDFDLGVETLPPGSRIRVGGALLEISALPHSGCKKFRQRFGLEALRWVNHKAHRNRRLRGVNCRVVSGGEVAIGDAVEPQPGGQPRR